MKRYIVIKHSNGLFSSIDGEFNTVDDAKCYAGLACTSHEGWDYDVYQKVEKQA